MIPGASGSFLSQETIERIAEAPLNIGTNEKDTSVFVPYLAIIEILAVYLLFKRN
ncbi:hypothetical protein J7W08_04315 [Methanococcoides orientis]|uniref:hypothetical protein n=1 Tax=Methanococcoides orientis TaxID=2822137 RepID=UPI001E45667F|nr:hypothetical protein [Methanococcoides orientis]UGV41520.1 hypothetical protein J7W08_04315 [Methanococcoides orientis]